MNMRRREFLGVLGGAATWPVVARSQQPGDIPRIGILWPGTSAPAPPRLEAFRQGLRELGFIDGQSAVIELRFSEKGAQELPHLAAELVRMNVNVILSNGDFAPRIAQQATTTIPIVALSDDILGAGIVTSLSRPGGNTTGVTILAPELSAKRLELLKEIVPGLSRVTALWDPTTGISQVSMTEDAARSLNLKLQVLEIRRRDEVGDAIRAARSSQTEALNILSSPFLASLTRDIVTFAAEYRLPAIYQWKEQAEAGGLVSYGPGLAAMFRQAAGIVVKIIKGTKPADLPVEQPTKFELIINFKTAKALGITVPPTLIARADEVIE
jgi:putative ABC transport system substrate-binding protein